METDNDELRELMDAVVRYQQSVAVRCDSCSTGLPCDHVGFAYRAVEAAAKKLLASRDASVLLQMEGYAEIESRDAEIERLTRATAIAHEFVCDFETPCTADNCEISKAVGGTVAITAETTAARREVERWQQFARGSVCTGGHQDGFVCGARRCNEARFLLASTTEEG